MMSIASNIILLHYYNDINILICMRVCIFGMSVSNAIQLI